jgi:hypothetical protein
MTSDGKSIIEPIASYFYFLRGFPQTPQGMFWYSTLTYVKNRRNWCGSKALDLSVLGSNSGRDTDYLEWGSSWFSSDFPARY